MALHLVGRFDQLQYDWLVRVNTHTDQVLAQADPAPLRALLYNCTVTGTRLFVTGGRDRFVGCGAAHCILEIVFSWEPNRIDRTVASIEVQE